MRGITKVFTSRYSAIAWATGIVVLAVQFVGVDDSHAKVAQASANSAAQVDAQPDDAQPDNAQGTAENDDQTVDQLGDPVTNQDESNLKNAIDSIG
ncbi:hypothetical protein ABDK56_07380 [Sphingomonas sp. ASV193]|uniref:hypothetical protein n=1 Tax=Sphingomonas sp. ASV193 TaxID=3144405 RepID=UPI0032E8AC37